LYGGMQSEVFALILLNPWECEQTVTSDAQNPILIAREIVNVREFLKPFS